MTSVLDKLNLRPQERRLVVAVAIVLFVVLNVWLVWPYYGEWGRKNEETRKAQLTLKRFSDEVSRKPTYERELKVLENAGLFVATEDQALQLMREVATQAAISGVVISRYDPTPRVTAGRTNSFFEEQTLVITVNTGEKELVEFLYNLSSRNSLIRVRSMTLSPEPSRFKLQGSMTLVESFQRKPKATPVAQPAAKPTNAPPKAAAAPAKPIAPVTKPAVAPAKTNLQKKAVPAPPSPK